MAYQTIEVRKLTPTIGAEISGVDLSKPLGNQQFQEVHDALMENLVIFFRDQKMTIDQHKDFGRRFGPLHTHPNAPITFPEHPEILVIAADEKSKRVAGEEWHTDVSCDAEPPMGSNMETPSGLMLPPAATPMPPWIMAPRSVMMSPKRLSVTTTSNHSGFLTNHMQVASTWA